ncbi:MAG: DNA-3-methyladenine glycosylase I [Bacteroidota bacterium]
MSYCEFTKDLPEEHPDRQYHDKDYGFPVKNDDELFGRLILEINQAGLSWSTILKKAPRFRKAYDQFSVEKIACYSDSDIERLMNDAGIIRNRKKITSAIHNAKVVQEIQQEWGSFENWLDDKKSLSLKSWVKVFRARFKFTGEKIIDEFLMSTSYKAGAHTKNCPIYDRVLKSGPKWL